MALSCLLRYAATIELARGRMRGVARQPFTQWFATTSRDGDATPTGIAQAYAR
jgi:hypothetical protein